MSPDTAVLLVEPGTTETTVLRPAGIAISLPKGSGGYCVDGWDLRAELSDDDPLQRKLQEQFAAFVGRLNEAGTWRAVDLTDPRYCHLLRRAWSRWHDDPRLGPAVFEDLVSFHCGSVTDLLVPTGALAEAQALAVACHGDPVGGPDAGFVRDHLPTDSVEWLRVARGAAGREVEGVHAGLPGLLALAESADCRDNWGSKVARCPFLVETIGVRVLASDAKGLSVLPAEWRMGLRAFAETCSEGSACGCHLSGRWDSGQWSEVHGECPSEVRDCVLGSVAASPWMQDREWFVYVGLPLGVAGCRPAP